MGLMSSLNERGVNVPERISVAGFDDIPFARYLTPPLTTASVPVTELGEQAWHRMWDLLNSGLPVTRSSSDHGSRVGAAPDQSSPLLKSRHLQEAGSHGSHGLVKILHPEPPAVAGSLAAASRVMCSSTARAFAAVL
jgi:hypothetical protein